MDEEEEVLPGPQAGENVEMDESSDEEDDGAGIDMQELEKRLEKPAIKKRIDMLAKRMLKDVRKKEVMRKKG